MLGVRGAWSADMGEELDDYTWDWVLDLIFSSSFNVRHHLIQFKVLHRIHWSTANIRQIAPNFDPTCIRCKIEPASLYHQFWACPSVAKLWDRIFKCLSDIHHTNIQPSPCIALFGVLPVNSPLSGSQHGAVALSYTYRKKGYSAKLEIP